LQWTAISSIASELGMTPEPLRNWVRRAETDEGLRPGLTISEREHMKALERENRELRRANEILKTAATFFGAELDGHGSWQAANHQMRTDLALDALKMAPWPGSASALDGLVHHSDRGVQYLSIRYDERLEAGIETLVAAAATPTTKPWPRASSASTRPRRSATMGPGRASKRSSRDPRMGRQVQPHQTAGADRLPPTIRVRGSVLCSGRCHASRGIKQRSLH
jgi:transposase